MRWFSFFGLLLFLGVALIPSTTVAYSGLGKTYEQSGLQSNERSSNIYPVFKPPFLTMLILFHTYFRYLRGRLLLNFSSDISSYYYFFPEFNVSHMFLFLRGCWLIFTSAIWLNYWMEVYENFGWDPIFVR
jgi:hypothetical protein